MQNIRNMMWTSTFLDGIIPHRLCSFLLHNEQCQVQDTISLIIIVAFFRILVDSFDFNSFVDSASWINGDERIGITLDDDGDVYDVVNSAQRCLLFPIRLRLLSGGEIVGIYS